jgi:rubredoxin
MPEIVCPECGGKLQYWKEYLITKTQMILPDGSLRSSVKTSKPEEIDTMQGFECIRCGWVFNTVNEVNFDGVEYLKEWLVNHEGELKV